MRWPNNGEFCRNPIIINYGVSHLRRCSLSVADASFADTIICKSNYKVFFPAAFALAQRAFAAAAILALAAALIVRLTILLAAGVAMDFIFLFAHRAFCAAAIASLPAALMRFFLRGAFAAAGEEPRAADNSPFNSSILSTMSAACLNWWDASDSKFMVGRVYARYGKAQWRKLLPRTAGYRKNSILIDLPELASLPPWLVFFAAIRCFLECGSPLTSRNSSSQPNNHRNNICQNHRSLTSRPSRRP